MADGTGPTVAAVIVTRDPNLTHLAWTLSRLADQDYPIEEAIIVDSSEDAIEVEVEGVPTRIVQMAPEGISAARRRGVRESTADIVIQMDEDAVFLRDDYVRRAVEHLADPTVSAVGGVVVPIRGNVNGDIIAGLDRINPSALGTHTLVHERAYCLDEGGDVCFPMADRGEDVSLRERLQQFGTIRRMADQAVLKDLPTNRQSLAQQVVVGTIVGSLTGALTGIVRDRLEETGGTVISRLTASP